MSRRLALRIFFTVLFAVICLVQCYSIMNKFLNYPTIINSYDESPSLVKILPALTVCNNNRVSLRKMMETNSTFKEAMSERFEGTQILNGRIVSLVDRRKFHHFRDEVSALFGELQMYPEKVAAAATLNDSFELQPDTYPFIRWFGCARTWKNSIDCENLSRVESLTSRRCTTLLHRGALLYDAYNQPQVFNATKEQSHSLNYFGAKEVVKLVIDFEPEDYGDLKRQIGARITIHDSNQVAGIGDLDYFITRGYRYDFSIDRLDTKLLGKPYGNCVDYHKMNLDKYKAQIEPRIPLASHTCFQNCVVKNVLMRSGCWPPSQPYYRNDSLDPDLRAKFCPWYRASHSFYYRELVRLDTVKRRMSGEANITTSEPIHPPDMNTPSNITRSEHARGYRKINRFCLSRCALSCRIIEYSVSVARSAWPSNVKVLFDKTGTMKMRRHCCALIVIKFAHFHYNIHQEVPQYEITNIVGDIGGLLAFWLGLSIVSIYNAIQRLKFCGKQSLRQILGIRHRVMQTKPQDRPSIWYIGYWNHSVEPMVFPAKDLRRRLSAKMLD